MVMPGVFKKPRLAHYIFPTLNTMASARVGRKPNMYLRYRVPNDDTTTTTFWINVIPDEPAGETVLGMTTYQPGVYAEIEDEWWGLPSFEQDRMATETQGLITDRSAENLASTDRGVLLFRHMIREAIDVVEEGGDPMEVFRDAAAAQGITFERTIEEMATLATV
jgi:5,5'-dehydrodivanillate O-demethylase